MVVVLQNMVKQWHIVRSRSNKESLVSDSFVPRIMTPTDSYVRCYPGFVDFANQQLEDQFWTSTEMKVELDRMQLFV